MKLNHEPLIAVAKALITERELTGERLAQLLEPITKLNRPPEADKPLDLDEVAGDRKQDYDALVLSAQALCASRADQQ